MSLSLVATNKQVTVTLYYSFFNRVIIFKPWPTMVISSTDVITCWFYGAGAEWEHTSDSVEICYFPVHRQNTKKKTNLLIFIIHIFKDLRYT